jgi:hypothetical protein
MSHQRERPAVMSGRVVICNVEPLPQSEPIRWDHHRDDDLIPGRLEVRCHLNGEPIRTCHEVHCAWRVAPPYSGRHRATLVTLKKRFAQLFFQEAKLPPKCRLPVAEATAALEKSAGFGDG